MTNLKNLPDLQCQRCGHKWIPRKPYGEIRICARCKSPYFDRPRKAKNKKENHGNVFKEKKESNTKKEKKCIYSTSPSSLSLKAIKEASKRIFIYWNTKSNLITHREASYIKFEPSIKRALKIAQENEILQAIDNYDKILGDSEIYYFTYRWTLRDFLNRGLERFFPENKPFERLRRIDSKTGQIIPAAKPVIKHISCPECTYYSFELALRNKCKHPKCNNEEWTGLVEECFVAKD